MTYRRRPVKVEAIEFDGSVRGADAVAKWTKGLVTEKILGTSIWIDVAIPGQNKILTLQTGSFLVKDNDVYWSYTPTDFWKRYEETV